MTHPSSSPAGPAAPSFTDLTATSVQFDRATIQWTVAVIAYTPETYVVNYGTDMSKLDSISATVFSGSDFQARGRQFRVVLFDLTPNSVTYYQLVASNTFTSTYSDVMNFTTSKQPSKVHVTVK